MNIKNGFVFEEKKVLYFHTFLLYSSSARNKRHCWSIGVASIRSHNSKLLSH